MSFSIDMKYWQEIEHKIKNKQSGHYQSATLYYFQCPICAGSKKHLNERTGSIFRGRDNQIHFQCFREQCKSQGFGKLLKHVDSEIANAYWKEKYGWKKSQKDILLIHDKKLKQNSSEYSELTDVTRFVS